MPIYRYACEECKHEFDLVQKMSDEPPKCEKCEAPTKKIITQQGLVKLYGKGFYKRTLRDTGDYS